MLSTQFTPKFLVWKCHGKVKNKFVGNCIPFGDFQLRKLLLIIFSIQMLDKFFQFGPISGFLNILLFFKTKSHVHFFCFFQNINKTIITRSCEKTSFVRRQVCYAKTRIGPPVGRGFAWWVCASLVSAESNLLAVGSREWCVINLFVHLF